LIRRPGPQSRIRSSTPALNVFQMTNRSISIAGLLSAAALALLLALPARAHNGPPFPIIENRRMAGCVVALWTHPDIGTGTFFVLVDPIPGGKIPDDLKVEIGIQPESGRLAEVLYPAVREDSRGQVEYNASAQFDRDEFYRVRLVLRSSQGTEEAVSRVEATPPGYGRWDLLIYLLPFLAVAFLWLRGMSRRRRYKKQEQELAGRIVSARRV
jgi:hypothetical protein